MRTAKELLLCKTREQIEDIVRGLHHFQRSEYAKAVPFIQFRDEVAELICSTTTANPLAESAVNEYCVEFYLLTKRIQRGLK